MIDVKDSIVERTSYVPSLMGDGSTSGTWQALIFGVTNITANTLLTLPSCAKSKGRIITIEVRSNSSGFFFTVGRNGTTTSDRITNAGSSATSVTTLGQNTSLHLLCDGSHWIVFCNDTNWS